MDRQLTDTYWLNIADEAPFGALIEHTNFIPPERYGGEHLLYVPKYVQSQEDEVWQMDDDEVREHWLSGIEDLFPEFDRSHVNWVETFRNPRTAPVYERGYLDMVIPYDLAADGHDGVYYAGMASRAQYPERSLNGGIVAGTNVPTALPTSGSDRVSGFPRFDRPSCHRDGAASMAVMTPSSAVDAWWTTRSVPSKSASGGSWFHRQLCFS